MKNTQFSLPLALHAAAALLLVVPFVAYGVDGTNVNGVTWAHSYEGDVMPSANSPAISEDGGFSGSTDGNILTITSGFGRRTAAAGIWDGNSVSGTTFEVRLRVTSQTGPFWGAFVEIGNGTGNAGIGIATNFVQVVGGGGNAIHFLDGTAFHTYRMTISNNFFRYYVDSDSTELGSFTLSGGAYNAFDFGYASGGAAGSSQYDFVRWTNAEATPVPEPSTALLASAMMLLGLAVRRRQR